MESYSQSIIIFITTFRKVTLRILYIMCLTQEVLLLIKFIFLGNPRADARNY